MSFRVIALICCQLFYTSISAQQAFEKHNINNRFTTVSSINNMHIVDLNQDGYRDILIGTPDTERGDQENGAILWFRNNGSGGFIRTTIGQDTVYITAVSSADIDSDGDTDILTASVNRNRISWYENEGAGQFTEHVITGNVNLPVDVKATDIDGDGDADVLSASYIDNKVALYVNDGSANFSVRTVTMDAERVESIFTADVNGDGHMDVLAAASDKIAWYKNDGWENFSTQTIVGWSARGKGVAAADITGNGAIDVITASASNNYEIALHENNGSEIFNKKVIFTGAFFASRIEAADIDADGDLDIVSLSEKTIRWFENRGDGTYPERLIYEDPQTTTLMAIGDLTDNSHVDVVTLAGGDPYLLVNQGAGIFDEQLLEANVSPVLISSNDIDLNGYPDVFVSNGGNIHYFLSSASASKFTPGTIDRYSRNLGIIRRIHSTDINRDGYADLFAVSNSLIYYKNNLNIGFERQIIDTVFYSRASLATVDFDGDMNEDILLGTITPGEVIWYKNDGFENFDKLMLNVGATGYFEVIDFDFDGDLDFISINIGPEIEWHQNIGNNTFTTFSIVSDLADIGIIKLGDIDLDGDIDILTTEPSENRVIWLENDGTFSFINHVVETGITGAKSTGIVDMDDDGDNDLLTVSEGAGKFGWHENDGSENFIYRVIADEIDGLTSILALDIDVNGLPDILPVSGLGSVAWYENLGPSTPIGNNEEPVATGFLLHQNYPNPFNPTTTIAFNLSVASNVALIVYDIRGREVATLLNEPRVPGYHEIAFDASELSSGVYFYRLEAREFSETRKMLLIR